MVTRRICSMQRREQRHSQGLVPSSWLPRLREDRSWRRLTRVLAVGGRFAHVGPLGYQSDNYADRYSAEGMVQELGELGFALVDTSSFASSHLYAPLSLAQSQLENLVYVADKRMTRQPTAR